MDTSEARAYSLERSFKLAAIHGDDQGALKVLSSAFFADCGDRSRDRAGEVARERSVRGLLQVRPLGAPENINQVIAQWLVTIGLLVDVAGALLIWKYGLPADVDPKGRSFLITRDTDPAQIATGQRYLRRSRLGLSLLIIGFMFQLVGAWSPSKRVATAPGTPTVGVDSAPHLRDSQTVVVGSKTIRLSGNEWVPMTNDFDWAVNFEQKTKGPLHDFARVVTIYKLPMTDDRRLGARISSSEYLELFVVHPGTLTAQVRADKGPYWVLSRETFRASSINGVDTTRPHALNEGEFDWARVALQTELDSTRFLLGSVF